jgi:hypothetical protein
MRYKNFGIAVCVIAPAKLDPVVSIEAMARGRYAVRRRATGIEIVLTGVLDSATVLACEREVRAQLSLAPVGGRALVDLSQVTGYEVDARDHLVSLQRSVGAKAAHTAYVAESAEARGLALWVMHSANERGSSNIVRPFARADDAAEWLSGGADLASGVREVEPVPALPRKRRRSIAS